MRGSSACGYRHRPARRAHRLPPRRRPGRARTAGVRRRPVRLRPAAPVSPPDPDSGGWRPAGQSDAFGDWFTTTSVPPRRDPPRRDPPRVRRPRRDRPCRRPAGPVRVAAVAVAAGPDRGGGGGDDGGGAVAVADRACGDRAGPPWRRRHHYRARGHWRAARRPGPATACHPAAAARHNAGAGYCQPVPGCRYRRRGWRYTCPRRHPGGTRARYAGRPGRCTPAVTIANGPGCRPASHYRAGTWRVRHEGAAARRAQPTTPRACHQHPAAACHHPVTAACQHPTAACYHPAAACHHRATAVCHHRATAVRHHPATAVCHHPATAARELARRAAPLRSQSMGRFLMTRSSCGHAADATLGCTDGKGFSRRAVRARSPGRQR